MRVAFVLFLLGIAGLLQADDRSAVLGRWMDDRSVLVVAMHGDSLSMRILAMKDPVYLKAQVPGPVGAPRRDSRNPDASLQHRSILGLELLVGYRWTGEFWEGEIYDPESGNTYKSRMEVDGEGRLSMRGYLGVPLFGRTALFTRAATCGDMVVAMMTASGVPDCV